MTNRKHPPISVHSTLNDVLEVNWQQEYKGEFNCPYCQAQKVTMFHYQKKAICKLSLQCNNCQKYLSLTQKIPGSHLKYLPISSHQTLDNILKINWRLQYKNEFDSPYCNQGKLTKYHYLHHSTCHLALGCNSCKKKTYLTCSVPVHISNYRSELECPNPLCTNLGHNGPGQTHTFLYVELERELRTRVK